jgi:transcriptional regulator with XRE-family HTH domain
MTNAQDILSQLSRRRHDLGMPYEELRRRSGVPISTLKRVLGGDDKASFATVAAISHALGVEVGITSCQDVADMKMCQARQKAGMLVSLVQGSSALEAQAVDETHRRLMEQKTTAELLAGSGLKLWRR